MNKKMNMNDTSRRIVREGDTMKVSPRLTNEPDWVEGVVVEVEQNPFKGLVIAIRDKGGRIFFGEEKYFTFS